METQEHTISKSRESRLSSVEFVLSTVVGALISVLLIGFFLIMKSVGLGEILAFRYFNFIFMAAGIISAFSYYKKKYSPEGLDYLFGLRLGLRITLIAIIPFSIFMGIYLKMDPGFMEYIINTADFGEYLTPISAAAAVGFEGFVAGALVSYITMPHFKKASEVSE